AVAILNVSTTYGLSDARFIATLGGMLFISGDFSEAAKIFQQSIQRDLPYYEASSIHYHPNRPGTVEPFTLKGRVLTVRPHLVIIESEGYPPFRCDSTRAGGTPFKVNTAVEFDVVFSARNALATKPRIIP